MINLLPIKFYNNYAILHIQHIPKPSYIRYYNVSRLFISQIYTQNSLHFNSPFSFLTLLTLYIYIYIYIYTPTHSLSCHPMLNTHRRKTMSFTFNFLTMYHLVHVSRFFIPHIYTQNSLHFNLPFSLLAILPLYIYIYIYRHTHTHSPSCHPMSNTHRP